MAMRKYLIALILVALLIAPAFAAEFTLTGYQEFNVFDVEKIYYTGVTDVSFDQSEEDKAITLIHFKVPQDSVVTYTIYYGVGNTASGSATNVWNISYWPAHTTTSTIVFDGQTKSYSYFDTNPDWDYYLSGYARRDTGNTTGLIVYSAGYGGFDNDLAVFKEVPNLASNLIYRVDLHCNTPFDVDISYGSKADVAASVSKTIFDIGNDWLDYALQIGGTILEVAQTAFKWIKFFFIDHLDMTVALYLAGSLAFSARACGGNPIKMLRQFFKDQKGLYTTILDLWKTLVELIASFRGIFRI